MSTTMTTVVPQRRVMSVQTAPKRVSATLKAEPRFGQYILGQTLGEGEFGKVKLGWPSKRTDNGNNAQVAIKLIRRESVGNSRSRMNKIEREINVLKKIRHPNIVQCYEVIETEKHIGIILEYASGGELFDFILAHRYLKDVTASRLFAQLISAVQYLHTRGIVHRDLKLENLLLDRNRNIIVTDFGFANTFDPCQPIDDVEVMKKREIMSKGHIKGDLMQTSCGSPCYAAPELVVSDGWYCGSKVDVWSCGVILYAMLSGYLPFDDDPSNPEGDNISLLYKYIVNTPLTFPEYVSPLARDLLRRILVPNPTSRASLKDVVCHSWLAPHIKNILAFNSKSQTKTSGSRATAAGVPQAEDMIRSASERGASHTSFALPTKNHLVPTGFSKNSSMGPPALSTPTSDKRHTIQLDYKVPSAQSKRSTSAETQVETLSIPVAPTMARSASHTGSNSIANVYQPVSNYTQIPTASVTNHRVPTKLPAPTNKPRPTSYHPAYRRPEEEIGEEKRIPSDPPASAADAAAARLGSSGSTTSRSSIAHWSKGNIHESKTASPRSTRQNASGEIYSSSQPVAVPKAQSAKSNAQVASVQSRARPAHRRNSSSISTLFGKFWPGGSAQETKPSSRTSQIYPSSPMDSIGETSAIRRSFAADSTDLSSLAQERRNSGVGSISSKLGLTGHPVHTNAHTKLAPHDEGIQDSRTMLQLKTKPAKHGESRSNEKTPTSAARRILGLFSARRKDRDEPHH